MPESKGFGGAISGSATSVGSQPLYKSVDHIITFVLRDFTEAL
jgi:hypothetical protein